MSLKPAREPYYILKERQLRNARAWREEHLPVRTSFRRPLCRRRIGWREIEKVAVSQ